MLYVRLSEITEASTSIERQETELREHASREGWDVVEVLADEGISGRLSRDNADRAVAMLASGEADVLAVWKFDRWSRQGLGAVAALIAALDKRPGASFVALRDGLSSDAPAWRIIASVLAETARMEAENTSARVRSAMQRARRARRYSGGNLPIGYESAPAPDGDGRILVPSPTTAPLLREAARRILDEGQSTYAVTLFLNRGPARPPRAESWSVQAVTQALTGNAIVGRVTSGGDVLRDDDGMPLQMWEPVLDLDDWHALRALVEQRRAVRAPVGERSSSRSRLLSGLVACAACGAPMYLRSNGSGVKTYGCSTRGKGRDCTASAVITAERVEEYVAERFLDLFGSHPVLAPVEVERPAVDLVEAERALAEITERLDASDLDDDEGDEHLLAQRRALRVRVRTLRASSAPATVQMQETGETVREVWQRSDVHGRRDLLANTFAAVEVSKGTRGRTGLDPSRVRLVGRHEIDPASDALAGQLD